MKKAVIISAAALALSVWVAGCSKLTTSEEAAPVEDVAANQSEPTTPAPTPAPVLAAATPAPKRFAPKGTFYLLRKKSVETSDGILGLTPGTQVTQQADGKYLVEGQTIALMPGEITNDLDIAAQAAGADARAQAAIRKTLEARPAPVATTSTSSSSNSASEPAPVQRPSSGFQSTSSLGATHTKTMNGYVWQKDERGEWQRMRKIH